MSDVRLARWIPAFVLPLAVCARVGRVHNLMDQRPQRADGEDHRMRPWEPEFIRLWESGGEPGRISRVG
jgi:hypothetical protein